MDNFINIVVPALHINNYIYIRKAVCDFIHVNEDDLKDFKIKKKSLDARGRSIKYNLRVEYSLGKNIIQPKVELEFNNVSSCKAVHIIGAGPAGYFAALEAINLGLKPIVYERGKDVRLRRRDLKKIHQDHEVNENSNYCYGEGGAGTYSDGKLYTRSKKRGNTLKVLELLVQFGAPEDILIDAHPHIGTNKLPALIAEIRLFIESCGGQIFFDSQLTDIKIESNSIKQIEINEDKWLPVNYLILATGHSARDIYRLLHQHTIKIEAKNFALGVRIEHPQALIDRIQYHGQLSCEYLPPAAYSLVAQSVDRGVYSFCMCPGGIIAPCATGQEEVVTNGWSPSKRNNLYANSGIVVEIKVSDVDDTGPLCLLEFQERIERGCWIAAGKSQKVPAQRMKDFIDGITSDSLPSTSYQPGLVSKDLNEVLPSFITNNLKKGLKLFGKKMNGYLTNEAVLHAPESRTSSPVRIPRDEENLNHIEILNLYPCGEGAGYAGGIVSAAVDGMRCVQAIKG